MDLSDQIQIFQILNIDTSQSTLSTSQLYQNTNTNDNESYIISDADEG